MMNSPATSGTREAGTLLLGCAAIATYLGVKTRQVQYAVDRGHIPTFRVGGKVAARKSSLDDWFARQEATGRAA